MKDKRELKTLIPRTAKLLLIKNLKKVAYFTEKICKTKIMQHTNISRIKTELIDIVIPPKS